MLVNSRKCTNTLVTHLEGCGLEGALFCPATTAQSAADSIWFYSPNTQTENAVFPSVPPPVTGPTSCCDINYCVFPYVPYLQGQDPSFIHSAWKLGKQIPIKQCFI